MAFPSKRSTTPAGALDIPVQFLARSPMSINGIRGGFSPLGGIVWGHYEDQSSYRITIGDFHASVPRGYLTVRDSPFIRAIGPGHRLEIHGRTLSVRSVQMPDRISGTITLEVLGTEGSGLYQGYVDAEGEVVTVRRAGSPDIAVPARARVTGYKPKELVAGMRQGDRQIILLADDLVTGAFPLPLLQTDKIIVRGAVLTMRLLDDSTHRFAGELLAYEIVAGG